MKRVISLSVFALLATGFVVAWQPTVNIQSAAAEDDRAGPAESARQLAAAVKTGEVAAIIAEMIRAEAITPAERPELELRLKRSREDVIARYGKPMGEVELIRKEVIGKSLVRFVYAEKLEKTVIFWRFAWYRGPRGWVIHSFNHDDKYEAEFRPVP